MLLPAPCVCQKTPALREPGSGCTDFRGILIADHVPQMGGERHTGWAFSLGYIRALYDMARAG